MALTNGPRFDSQVNSIVSSGLVLHLDAINASSYPGTGTTWFDLSPSGLNATGSTAISGQSLLSNQPYTTASTSILNNDSHTICMLLQISSVTGTWDKVFEYAPAGTDRSPGIWRFPLAKRIHWRYDASNSGTDFDATTTSSTDPTGEELTNNKWYYACVSKNGNVATVYMNGAKFGTNIVTSPKFAGTSTIKLYPAYTDSNSRMQAVHIYNRVLSDAEIKQNFRYLMNTRTL